MLNWRMVDYADSIQLACKPREREGRLACTAVAEQRTVWAIRAGLWPASRTGVCWTMLTAYSLHASHSNEQGVLPALQWPSSAQSEPSRQGCDQHAVLACDECSCWWRPCRQSGAASTAADRIPGLQVSGSSQPQHIYAILQQAQVGFQMLLVCAVSQKCQI